MIRVHVRDDFMGQRYELFILETQGSRTTLLRGDGSTREVLDSEVVADPDPSVSIPYDAAPAVLGALARQLGAVEHPEQLRKDYEAERRRVDRFIAHLTPGVTA